MRKPLCEMSAYDYELTDGIMKLSLGKNVTNKACFDVMLKVTLSDGRQFSDTCNVKVQI